MSLLERHIPHKKIKPNKKREEYIPPKLKTK